jgi:spermidine/putrescine-binding protein
MRIKILSILFFCLLAVLPAVSQTVAYSLNDAPLFTVRMPDGWRFESKANPRNPATKRISGTASNGLVWFGIWVVKDAKNVDAAYKYVQTTARALIKDAKETMPATNRDVNGMKAKYSEHSGTMKMQDGKSQMFDAQVLLFETGSGTVGIAVCMADTEGLKAEKANIDAFFKSIKRAGK